jgi:hypothetical protein
MFLLDDLILEHLGICIPGMDLLWTFEQLNNMAFKELYDPEKIGAMIKENRMLFEFGEIPKEEYEARNEELLRKMRLAHRAEEMDLNVRCDILGGT